MRTIGVGVVGLGYMGEQYARILHQLPQARLVAVCDIARDRTGRLGDELGVPGYTSHLDMLAGEPALEAVVVATPERQHTEPVVAAARHGKHILVEKPLSADEYTGRQMLQAAGEAGVTLMVGQLQRFDPRYGLLRDAVQAGELGEIVHVYMRLNGMELEARRVAAWTTVVDFLGVHVVDTVHWITGQQVTRVYARGVEKVLSDLGVDDCVVAMLTLESGAIALLETSWVMPDDCGRPAVCQSEWVGTKGCAEVMEYEQGLALFTPGRSTYPDSVYFSTVRERSLGVLREETAHFVDSLAAGKAPLVSGEEGLNAVIVCQAIKRSAAEGRELSLSWPA